MNKIELGTDKHISHISTCLCAYAHMLIDYLVYDVIIFDARWQLKAFQTFYCHVITRPCTHARGSLWLTTWPCVFVHTPTETKKCWNSVTSAHAGGEEV